jgi:hypothetical protein
MLNWFVASAKFEDFQRSQFYQSLINYVHCLPLYFKVHVNVEHLISSLSILLESPLIIYIKAEGC